MTTKFRKLGLVIAGATSLTLAGCGGGSDGGGTVPPVPAPVQLTGKVFINMAVKNALVCMDLNANNKCDTGEPTSALTDASGAYRLTYDPAVVAAVQVAAAPIIAQITPGTLANGSVDAVDPTTTIVDTAYTLSAPAGKATQINPLTSLVQAGVKAGLTLATSEASVALQLEIPATEIYDYQSNGDVRGDSFADSARLMALVTADALEAGIALAVVDPATTTSALSSQQLARLDYTGTDNFLLRTREVAGIAAANGRVTITETRTGKSAGVAVAHDTLYPSVYLTKSGWVRCDELSGFSSTLGTPNRSSTCSGGEVSVGYTTGTDISGKSMASVVTGMQGATDASNSINVNATLLGANTFPAGSVLGKRTSYTLSRNLYINNTNTDAGIAGGVATLEALIAARPSSGVNLTNGNGMVGLGLIDDTHSLRLAFKDAVSAVQFYRCDYASVTDSNSNCAALPAGTFAISTVNNVRVISYSGQPVTSMNHVRGHAEYLGKVATYRQNKPDLKVNLTYSQRINGPALQALKNVLSL